MQDNISTESLNLLKLMFALKSRNSKVRWQARIDLLEVRDVGAIEHLLNGLKDNNSFVRRSAAEALGHFDSAAIESLTDLLKDKSPSVRYAAAQSLGQIGDARAVELLKALLRDKNSKVREIAVRALTWIGGKNIVEPLIQMLENKNEKYFVRQRIISALGDIRDKRAIDVLLNVYDEAQQNTENGLLYYALDALSGIDDERVVEIFSNILKDENNKWRILAAQVIGRKHIPKMLEPLIATLKDEDPKLRSTTVEALGKYNNKRAFEALVSMLNDREDKVRNSATFALTTYSLDVHYDEQTLDLLIADLQSEDANVRRKVVEFLGRRGEKHALPYLTWIQQHDMVQDVRSAALTATNLIKSKRIKTKS